MIVLPWSVHVRRAHLWVVSGENLSVAKKKKAGLVVEVIDGSRSMRTAPVRAVEHK